MIYGEEGIWRRNDVLMEPSERKENDGGMVLHSSTVCGGGFGEM